MTMLTSKNLVAFAVIAIASFAILCGGCSRDEEPRAASGAADQPAVTRTDDSEYIARLGESAAARDELLALRASLMARMEAEDADKEFLQARIDDVNKALEDVHRHAAAIVRERIWSGAQKESAAQ